MRRLLVLTMALAMTIASGSVATATTERCTQGDVTALTGAGFQGARLANQIGVDVGHGEAWNRCQFRLYDDNGPTEPHTFSEADYFLGGIFYFTEEAVLDEFDISRADAISFMELADGHFYFGADGKDLVEIPLIHTNYRNNNNKDFRGWMVGNHRYHIFEPGSLEPGLYHWNYQETHPAFPGEDIDWHGEVLIISG